MFNKNLAGKDLSFVKNIYKKNWQQIYQNSNSNLLLYVIYGMGWKMTT